MSTLDDGYYLLDEVDPKGAFFCVSIYNIDRAYGGPEEGGWWYTYGEPEMSLGEHTLIFTDWVSANDYREQLEETLLDALNEGRPDISSVLSIGRYSVVIDVGHYPRPFPERTPHYE